MKNLLLLAVWAMVLSFLLSFFYWHDAPLSEQLIFGVVMTVVTGAWMLALLNLPRAVAAVRQRLKSSRAGEGRLAQNTRKSVVR